MGNAVFPEARNVADGNEMALRRVPEAPNVAHSNEMAGRRFPILVWPARLSLMGDECPATPLASGSDESVRTSQLERASHRAATPRAARRYSNQNTDPRFGRKAAKKRVSDLIDPEFGRISAKKRVSDCLLCQVTFGRA